MEKSIINIERKNIVLLGNVHRLRKLLVFVYLPGVIHHCTCAINTSAGYGSSVKTQQCYTVNFAELI